MIRGLTDVRGGGARHRVFRRQMARVSTLPFFGFSRLFERFFFFFSLPELVFKFHSTFFNTEFCRLEENERALFVGLISRMILLGKFLGNGIFGADIVWIKKLNPWSFGYNVKFFFHSIWQKHSGFLNYLNKKCNENSESPFWIIVEAWIFWDRDFWFWWKQNFWKFAYNS